MPHCATLVPEHFRQLETKPVPFSCHSPPPPALGSHSSALCLLRTLRVSGIGRCVASLRRRGVGHVAAGVCAACPSAPHSAPQCGAAPPLFARPSAGGLCVLLRAVVTGNPEPWVRTLTSTCHFILGAFVRKFKKNVFYYAITVVPISLPLPPSTQCPPSLQQSPPLVHVHGSYM